MAVSASTLRLTLIGLLVPVAIEAQQVPSAALKPANGVIKAPFANVTSMHELHDGRTIMVDAMRGMVLAADFATGKYANVDGVPAMPIVAFPGDTTVSTGLDQRWIFVAGTHPIGMLDRTSPVVQRAGGFISGADARGNILGDHSPTPGHGDSSDVLLISRETAAVDTVARLSMPPRGTAGAPRAVFTRYEKAVLSLDGWIAVLRMDPYRIDWRSPDGKWILGKPIAAPLIPLDDREKQAYMLRRTRGGKPEAPETITNWPETIPPWTYALISPIHSPDGNVLVLRTPSADFPDPRYDVINRHGELERQVTLRPKQFILGFGAKSV